MSRRLALLVAFAVLSPHAASAEEWWTWRPWASHTRQNIRWPEQYLPADRVAARAPFSVMIANGWRAQNTVSDYHFNEVTGDLNDTGMQKVRSIMRDNPEEWRTIYVLRGDRAELTASRLKSVQDYAFELAQGDVVPPVLVTTVEPRGTRGDQTNRVSQQFIENAPIPVLPPSSSSGESN